MFSPSAGFSKISRVSAREEVGRLHMHSCKGRGSSVHFIGARRQQRISKAQDGKKGNRGKKSPQYRMTTNRSTRLKKGSLFETILGCEP